jgi:metal-responsive CopG/Arc/MetJ family transcriptional regulator
MPQINLNATRDLVRDLERLMKERGFRHKAEAIRSAVREAVERGAGAAGRQDFHEWVGLAAEGRPNARRRFRDQDALWEPRG